MTSNSPRRTLPYLTNPSQPPILLLLLATPDQERPQRHLQAQSFLMLLSSTHYLCAMCNPRPAHALWSLFHMKLCTFRGAARNPTNEMSPLTCPLGGPLRHYRAIKQNKKKKRRAGRRGREVVCETKTLSKQVAMQMLSRQGRKWLGAYMNVCSSSEETRTVSIHSVGTGKEFYIAVQVWSRPL